MTIKYKRHPHPIGFSISDPLPHLDSDSCPFDKGSSSETMTVPLQNRLLKALLVIVFVSCGLLLGTTYRVQSIDDSLAQGQTKTLFNLSVDANDPTLTYIAVGGGIVQMSKFHKENFTYVEHEDPKFLMKSFTCKVEEWNKVHTDRLPNAEEHAEWMRRNISRKNYLYHTSPSPFAAFVHDEHITVTLSAENMFGKTVFCRYYDCNRRELPEVFQSRVFPESTVYCGRRIGAKFVSITQGVDDVAEPPVPLHSRITHGGPQHYFTVCMATLYGEEPKFVQIVDFIEHHKLQGATFFHIYLRNVSAYDRMLLDDYVRTGEIELIVLNDKYWRADFMWHMMQINDCHMRNVNFAKWTALLDSDERLEMRMDNWRVVDYLDTITNPNVNNLQFSVQWVLKDEGSPARFENDSQFVQNLVFQRFHNTSRIANYWVQPKSVIRPERIAAMTIHAPLAVYKGFIKTFVNSTIGVIRHYRNIEGGALINNNHRAFEMGPYNTTHLEPDFEKKLTDACLRRVKQVYDTVSYSCDMIQEMYHIHGLTHACYIQQLREKKRKRKTLI
ncbi:unnamed protein product [Caenorhabditis sp. 36 PRJEB53466]|nr:unnamed protein product [Caenorhabditis sp. 36 PRJEB53466]